MTSGLASASFCWIACAAWYDASASAGLPVRDSTSPMLLWLNARSIVELRVSAGLASASFCRIARAAWYDTSASAGLPVSDSSTPMSLWVDPQFALELDDGGVGVGQPLPDRPRRLVRRQRLFRLAGCFSTTAILLWLIGEKSLSNSVIGGLASASFCRIASAAWCDPSAWSGLPVSSSRVPMLLWLIARSRWNSATAGLASASFCWIANAA